MKSCPKCQAGFAHDGWQCPSCGHCPVEQDGFLLFAPEVAMQNDGFHPELFEELCQLESENFWFRVRNQLIVWALGKYFPEKKSMLEIGCGTGYVLKQIEESEPALACFGSEIHLDGLIWAQRRLRRSKLWQMDAINIPFRNEFSVIGAFDVIEHIDADERALQQIYQAVKPGGGILLTVPQHPFLWSLADEYACHKRRYTRSELRLKVENAGFKVLHTTSFVSLLMPLIILSRKLPRKSKSKFDPLAELKINRLVNWALERVLKFEALMIRFGVSWPFGGSLLLIAYKSDKA